MLSVWKVNKIVEVMYLQFPITAVLTTAVNNMSWFSAVLLVNRAVVYLSQNEVVFWAVTVLMAAARARDFMNMIALV